MKGTIVKCVQELVIEKFGAEKWAECLRASGVQDTRTFTTNEDIPDKDFPAIFKAVALTTRMNATHLMDEFGEHWSTVYAPREYSFYFNQAKSTREMLLKLDQIHIMSTRTVPSAHPPHFRYEWQGENHLVMHYESARGMAAFMPGLIRGLGKHFKDNPLVTLDGNAVHIELSAVESDRAT